MKTILKLAVRISVDFYYPPDGKSYTAQKVPRMADAVARRAYRRRQVGAEVDVTLEIEASLPNGVTDQTVRIVTENSRTLKLTSHEFESE